MSSSRPAAAAHGRLHPLLIAALAWLALADLPTGWRVGPLSVSGLATLMAGSAAVLLAPVMLLHGRGRSSPRSWRYLIPPGPRRAAVPSALVAFCGVALLGVVRSPTQNGLQQVSVYLAFTGAVAVGALYSDAQTCRRFSEALGVVMGVVGLLAVPLYAAGLTWLGGARSFALTALVAVAALVPIASTRPLVRIAPYALTAGIAASLSRTALALAVLLLAFAVLRSRRGLRGVRIAGALLALAGAGVVAFLAVPSLRDRFTTGDNGLDVGGVAVNTSGRSEIWAVVIRSALRAPWFGQGAGTASDVVTARYPFIGQPHNDWLRLWHDFGAGGAALFLLAWGGLIIGAVRRARATDQQHRGIHWSAALALSAVGLAALTDNPFIYPFVMVPLGALVGVSVARRGLDPAPARPSAARPVRRPMALRGW